MSNTRIVIENNLVSVINDDLTSEERNKIKYEVYKQINGSYDELLKHLPKTDGNDQ